MISARLKFLSDIVAWNGFSSSNWLLYKDDPRASNVIAKYRSDKSYIFQELKVLVKAFSLVASSKVIKIEGDFASIHSENQHAALLKLGERFPFFFTSFEYNKPDVVRLKMTPKSFCALFIFLLFNARYLRKLTKKTFHYHQLKVLIYGLTCRDQINFKSVDNIFVSNDHHSETRVFLYFREKYNFSLIYKQHAQVSELFPPLVWDHVILDGQMAHMQYQNIGNLKSKVWIIGSDKTADLVAARGKFDHKKIGVAINSLDDLERLSQYLKKVSDLQEIDSFLVRLHPALRKDSSEVGASLRFNKNVNLIFHTGDLINYFSQISICISGASSILLEAAICKKLCVQHDFVPKAIGDYYGFLRENLAMPHEAFLALDAKLANWDELIEIQTNHARIFSASLGNKTEGDELSKFLSEYPRNDVTLNANL